MAGRMVLNGPNFPIQILHTAQDTDAFASFTLHLWPPTILQTLEIALLADLAQTLFMDEANIISWLLRIRYSESSKRQ